MRQCSEVVVHVAVVSVWQEVEQQSTEQELDEGVEAIAREEDRKSSGIPLKQVEDSVVETTTALVTHSCCQRY